MGTHRREKEKADRSMTAYMRGDASERSVEASTVSYSQQGASPPQTPSSSSASSSLAYAMPPPIPLYSSSGGEKAYAAGTTSLASAGGSSGVGGGGGGLARDRVIVFDRSMTHSEKHDLLVACLTGLLREPEFLRKSTFEAMHFHKFWYV
jgi:hypothetical protein